MTANFKTVFAVLACFTLAACNENSTLTVKANSINAKKAKLVLSNFVPAEGDTFKVLNTQASVDSCSV